MAEQYKKRVYISGPIEGVENYMQNFSWAAEKVKKMGLDPVNPAECFSLVKDVLSRDEMMGMCFNLLEKCDCIYMLAGWQASKGAKEELQYAINRNFDVMVDTYDEKEKASECVISLYELAVRGMQKRNGCNRRFKRQKRFKAHL